jgi:outer membrane protein TolC
MVEARCGHKPRDRPLRRWVSLAALLWGCATGVPLPATADAPIERRWREIDAHLRSLDTLLPPLDPPQTDASPRPFTVPPPLLAPEVVDGDAPASQPVTPPAPLSLPTADQLSQGAVRPLSLRQALAIAFDANPSLAAQREEVAASLAELQSELGTWWPRILAFAEGLNRRTRTSLNAPKSNSGLGLGPRFQPGGAFHVPAGGTVVLDNDAIGGGVGLELRHDLVDLARVPRIRAARAQLDGTRQRYASRIRDLQLEVSEAYHLLQRADQNVSIRDAVLRNDLQILRDSLDLKRAGLVPRLDVLRRQAIEASDREQLIQALADQAIARRRLARLLNLPAGMTPVAADPIALTTRWPLDLERTLLEAYRGNPELEAILAVRQALASRKDAVAAALLPRLSLFAQVGGSAENLQTLSIRTSNGGCCGSSVLPVRNSYGYDWSVGLAVRWLLFDGGTTRGTALALERRERAIRQDYAERRDRIRLRLEEAFFEHEASLARLNSARRGAAAAMEAFRDARLRYQLGLSSEVEVSVTQDQLLISLLQRLNATVAVNITYARLLRELLPVPRDPEAPIIPELKLSSPGGDPVRPGPWLPEPMPGDAGALRGKGG